MNRPKIITVTLNPCIDKTVQVCAFTPGETHRILSERTDIGGKGLNVSRVLRGSGIPVLTAALVCERILPEVHAEFSDADTAALLIPTESETRVNLKILDTQNGGMTELNAPGNPVGAALSRLQDALFAHLPDTKILVLSGSLPPDVDCCIYRDWIVKAKRHGVRVVLDADGNAMRQGVDAAPFAVKPNLAELERWAGHALQNTAQILLQIHALHKKGVALVCVSMGADGALFSMDGTVLRAEPFSIRVGSPAAAGDAMAAVLAYGIANGLSLSTIAKLATAAGTCTAEKPGTQTAAFSEICRRAENIILTKEESL